MKKLLSFLTLWDGFWSVPLAFILFLLCEYLGRWFFGAGFGAYDPATFQAAIMAAVILIFTNTVVQFAIKFNFPAFWDVYHNSFCDTFQNLQSWQKIAFTVFMYCFFFALFLQVLYKLI